MYGVRNRRLNEWKTGLLDSEPEPAACCACALMGLDRVRRFNPHDLYSKKAPVLARLKP
ncbi:hypothetical protein [Polaromonas sp.]|uniref:hypothetical protein n=1 Tax=Polaromonas sp. TaxID=1869339 RepID=UPI002735E9C5|nr:hypothetical protein [Polaromonas sp.]